MLKSRSYGLIQGSETYSITDQIGRGEPGQQAHGPELAGNGSGQSSDDGGVDGAQEDAYPAGEEDQPEPHALDLVHDDGLLLGTALLGTALRPGHFAIVVVVVVEERRPLVGNLCRNGTDDRYRRLASTRRCGPGLIHPLIVTNNAVFPVLTRPSLPLRPKPCELIRQQGRLSALWASFLFLIKT